MFQPVEQQLIHGPLWIDDAHITCQQRLHPVVEPLLVAIPAHCHNNRHLQKSPVHTQPHTYSHTHIQPHTHTHTHTHTHNTIDSVSHNLLGHTSRGHSVHIVILDGRHSRIPSPTRIAIPTTAVQTQVRTGMCFQERTLCTGELPTASFRSLVA